VHENWFGRFAFIWTGQTMSQAGSRIATFALIWWLTQATGSAQVLATATLASLIPLLLLRPLTGALVDRLSRKWVIVLSDAAIALASLWLAWMFWSGAMHPWHVYIVVAVRAVGEAFHAPAKTASTPLLVPDRHLSRLAGVDFAILGGLKFAGPVLGALAITLLPLHGVMLIDVSTAVLAILPVLIYGIPQPRRTMDVRRARFLASIGEAIRFIRSAPGLLVVSGYFALSNALGALVWPFLPLYILEYFKGGAMHLATLEAGDGIGFILGGALFVLWPGFKGRLTTMFIAASLQATCGILVGFSPSGTIAFAVAGMAINGLMNTYVNAPSRVLVQRHVPHEMQGRLSSIGASISWSLRPFAVLAGGFLVERYGFRPLAQAVGIFFLFSWVLALLPASRNLEATLKQLNAGRDGGEAADE
jgi:DHA3 family macrolide efflux protein-like MFS transporter